LCSGLRRCSRGFGFGGRCLVSLSRIGLLRRRLLPPEPARRLEAQDRDLPPPPPAPPLGSGRDPFRWARRKPYLVHGAGGRRARSQRDPSAPTPPRAPRARAPPSPREPQRPAPPPRGQEAAACWLILDCGNGGG
uniref:Uncharacterized protein n=1 Tax=Aegilops tauschii subsp. strangulata TaxID=200361 RepID=A0A453DHR3_AEGTS